MWLNNLNPTLQHPLLLKKRSPLKFLGGSKNFFFWGGGCSEFDPPLHFYPRVGKHLIFFSSQLAISRFSHFALIWSYLLTAAQNERCQYFAMAQALLMLNFDTKLSNFHPVQPPSGI